MSVFHSSNDGAALTKNEVEELNKFAQLVASRVFNKPVFDKPETCAFLCIAPRTLDEWMRRKRIPFSKLPSGAVRFRRDQLIEFLKKYEVA
jgi:Helix-turn-helix domain